MPHDISPVQARLLKRLNDSKAFTSVSTSDLGHVRDDAGELGAETARRACDRLKARGYVADHGARQHRTWSITAAGVAALAAFTGVPGDWTRKYVILQRVSLAEADLVVGAESTDTVWVDRGQVSARNTEHAYRLSGQVIADDGPQELVAIPARNFQPDTVDFGTTRTVTIR